MKKVINWLKGLVNCGNYTEASVISYGIIGSGTIGYSNLNYMISRMDITQPGAFINEDDEEFE